MALFLPDANVLIHALRKDSAEHDSCRRWLMNAAASGDGMGLCELVEARRLAAGIRHSRIVSDFITALGLSGNDVNDVWLAALAIEHRATLVSTDLGFARFPGLSWINPMDT